MSTPGSPDPPNPPDVPDVPDLPDALARQVDAWIADDPDPADRDELIRLCTEARRDSSRRAELVDRFRGPLRFGTAGLRGPLRAGPAGMNTAVVRRTAAGLAAWLTAGARARPARAPAPDLPPGAAPRIVVLGYDARHRSEAFALDSARVLAAAGLRALVLPGPTPTPVLAFAVRHLHAAAGVMVTASHNPAGDNGYKVYLGGAAGDPARGAQLVAPTDGEIERMITTAGPARAIPLAETWSRLGKDIVNQYVRATATADPTAVPAAVPTPERAAGPTAAAPTAALAADPTDPTDPAALTVAYTPLHGVGRRVLDAVFDAAGLAAPVVVADQAEPDPRFPTVRWPNPEEPGAMDLVLALGERIGADLVLANDPDADRCAVAVGRRVLTGDEIGLLLADDVLRSRPGTVATSIVSSSGLRALATQAGVDYVETLTGFKWIMRAAADMVFGYEEALGYAVAPELVRDKDGITAALAVTRIAHRARRRGLTLLDLLDELYARIGVHLTGQLSVRVDDTDRLGAMMHRLRAQPPTALAGHPVTAVRDLAAGTGTGAVDGGSALPPADVLLLTFETDRVVFRPSGTEPKLKVYLETVEAVTDHDVEAVGPARQRAAGRLAALREATGTLLREA